LEINGSSSNDAAAAAECSGRVESIRSERRVGALETTAVVALVDDEPVVIEVTALVVVSSVVVVVVDAFVSSVLDVLTVGVGGGATTSLRFLILPSPRVLKKSSATFRNWPLCCVKIAVAVSFEESVFGCFAAQKKTT
jgi:hypothetical protein